MDYAFIKSDLIAALKKRLSLPTPTGAKIVDLILDAMTDALKRGESVEIPGIGVLVQRTSKRSTRRAPSPPGLVGLAGPAGPENMDVSNTAPKTVRIKVLGEMSKRLNEARSARRWFTTAYFTEDGYVHPAYTSFYQRECSIDTIVAELSKEMSQRKTAAHIAMIWEGQIAKSEALSSSKIPTYAVYRGGAVEKIKLKTPLNFPAPPRMPWTIQKPEL
jgi:nucleoid DNA-binding protein